MVAAGDACNFDCATRIKLAPDLLAYIDCRNVYLTASSSKVPLRHEFMTGEHRAVIEIIPESALVRSPAVPTSCGGHTSECGRQGQ
jgi:hypothetical protein